MAKASKSSSEVIERGQTQGAAQGMALVPSKPPSDLSSHVKNEAAAAFLDGLEGNRETPRTIPIITIDHKTAQFVLPSGEVVPEVSGYPVYYFSTRRFYKKPPQPGQKGQPPDCWSPDMVAPSPEATDKQNDTCAGCPMSEWGTARDGRGQACATHVWVFLLNPDFGTPPIGVLVLPPSSIRPLIGTKTVAGYLGRAAARHGVYEIVWTTMGLKQMGDQVVYCVVEPIMGEPAPIEQARQIRDIRNQMLAMMDATRGKTAEVTPGQEDVS